MSAGWGGYDERRCEGREKGNCRQKNLIKNAKGVGSKAEEENTNDMKTAIQEGIYRPSART